MSEKYHLSEMPTTSYRKRTEQNVLDSDGTVIFTYGELEGGSRYTEIKAYEHNKPMVHIDMNEFSVDDAIVLLDKFVDQYRIEVLNVAGGRASKDDNIYNGTYKVIEGICK